MTELTCALVGLGMVAQTHLLAIRDCAEPLRLKGVFGRDAPRRDAFAGKAADLLGHDVHSYESAQSIADDKEVDLVILITPPNARTELVRMFARAGKAILMEKPLERDLEAAKEIARICEEHAVPTGVFFQHRFRAASEALDQAVRDGVLGEIGAVEIRVPWWRDQSYYDEPGRGTYERDGGGVMISQAIHTLDLALSILGPVDALKAHMKRLPVHDLEAENWATALLEFGSGAVGNLMATTAAFPGSTESLTVHGTQGSAHLDKGVLQIDFLDGRQESVGASATTGGGADPMAFTHGWHQAVLEDFVRALRDKRPARADARAALHAHAVIDAMERAAQTGQKTQVTPV